MTKSKNKRKMKEMTTDEFLEMGLSGSDTSDADSSDHQFNAPTKKIAPKPSQQTKIGNDKLVNNKEGSKVKRDTTSKSMKKSDVKGKKTGSIAQHKASLEKLKEQDPEFYEFLKEEDQKLLNFNAPEDEDDDEDDSSSDMEEGDSEEEELSMEEEDSSSTNLEEEESLRKTHKSNRSQDKDDFLDDSEDSDEEGLHTLPDQLEEVTDSEEDEEEEEEEAKEVKKSVQRKDIRQLVTMKMINEWTASLQETSPKALKQVVQAFRAAVQRAGSDAVHKSLYKVEGGTIFNAIIRMCIKELPPMLNRLIKLPKPKDSKRPLLPLHSPQWKPICKDMICYLTDLIQLVTQLAEPNILNVMLKHVSQMIPYYACNPKLTKAMLRKLISLWSVGEETSRVLAFISLNRLTRLRQDTFLEFVMKQMYMSYVKNCKFTSPTTLPLINFMQHSMVEIFAIDHELTYQYAFVYIRQLAIHLRNAITLKKKDTCQAVYNWQYIHSLCLWSRTLSQLYPSDVLQPLIYPLVQTIIGTIKLIPTDRYFPLRFHCVQTLNTLSRATKTFIPTMPFIVEVFDLTDFNKKHSKASIKPLNMTCILKLSKAQLHEKSFRDGVIDQIYEHMMEALHTHAHTIGFPELVLPALIQMKKFVKKCKVPNYTKQIKQIIDKVEQTSTVITRRRQSAALSLSNIRAVELWEKKSIEEGTPLGKYYANWRKLRDRELQFVVSGKDRISTDKLPVIERRPKDAKKAKAKDEFTGLFASDSEDDSDSDDDANRFLAKEERPIKKQKTSKNEDSDYSDLDENDLDKLAQSASEDDDDNDGDESDDGEDDEEDMDDDDNDAPDQDDIVEDLEFSDED